MPRCEKPLYVKVLVRGPRNPELPWRTQVCQEHLEQLELYARQNPNFEVLEVLQLLWDGKCEWTGRVWGV